MSALVIICIAYPDCCIPSARVSLISCALFRWQLSKAPQIDVSLPVHHSRPLPLRFSLLLMRRRLRPSWALTRQPARSRNGPWTAAVGQRLSGKARPPHCLLLAAASYRQTSGIAVLLDLHVLRRGGHPEEGHVHRLPCYTMDTVQCSLNAGSCLVCSSRSIRLPDPPLFVLGAGSDFWTSAIDHGPVQAA